MRVWCPGAHVKPFTGADRTSLPNSTFIQQLRVGSLKLTMVEVFTPRKWANANQAFLYPGRLLFNCTSTPLSKTQSTPI